MFKIFLIVAVLCGTGAAFADMSLPNNGKVVHCTDSGLSVTLSADRKTMRVQLLGQDSGFIPVTSSAKGKQGAMGNWESYDTSIGELTFGDATDEYISNDSDLPAYFPTCE